MIRVALYARVSMDEQNPEAQIAALRKEVERRGFTIYKEHVDHVTGNVDRRRRERSKKAVAYQQLMVDAHARKFDVVMVWKFDRFARSLTALIEALETFKLLGIDFISATQQIDTTTPIGKLFFHMVGAFAEFEREMIVERINSGLDNARAKGIRLGRPRFPGEEKCVEQHKQGQSISAIARSTNRSRAGVRKILLRSGIVL